ncbi:hypothetical protein SSV2p20 [Sulfolobus spindle-shaped virus 2]|uniref:Fuselloviral protein SSV2p20 n=2 Tax=root TaxID=1 RepID=A0A157SYU9_SACSO|nr:hypothetical protein SSV2p20 [Sulfolobus spindle-shaped virus 2]AAQ73267.1 ORF 48 [Sulfolobus spindle-shaped virus 2]SAI84245.1 Fuselloviral protein SSV2p20 [Saccharolobus solfataricus]
MMLMYQCLRCGSIFDKRSEVIEHLLSVHGQMNKVTLEYFYIYFKVRRP